MKRLFIWTAFLLLCGKVVSQEVYQRNQSYWVPRYSPRKPVLEEIAPLPELTHEDVPAERPIRVIPQYQTLTKGDLQNRQSTSLADALTSLGFQLVSSGGRGTQSSLIYKGYSGFDIKVYVDGVLANSTTTGEFDWNSLDISTVENITIVEVPSLGISEFAGCVVQIKTSVSRVSSLLASTSLSSYLSKERQHWADGLETKFSITDKRSAFSYNFTADVSHDKNEYLRNVSTPVNWDNFDRLFNTQLGTSYEGKKLQDRAIIKYTNNYLKCYSTGATLANGIQTDHIVSFQNILDCSLPAEWQLTTTQQVRYDYMQYERNNARLNGNYDRTKTFLTDVSILAKSSFDFGQLSFGTSYRFRELLSSGHKRNELGLTTEYSYSWERFGLTTGINLLAYWTEECQQVQPLPYLSLYGDWWSLSVYRSFVLPTFNQLYWGDMGYACGNPDLNPEQGYGLTSRFGKEGFPLWGNFTGSYYENKIRWVYHDWRLTPVNSTYTWLFAAQAGVDLPLPFGSWIKERMKLQGDVTYTRSWLRGETRQIMWVPEWKAHGSITYKDKLVTAVIDCNYMGSRYISNLNYDKYPAYLMFDACLTVEPLSGVSLYAKVKNALDIRVVHHDGYFIPSRQLVLGIQFMR